MSSTVESLLAAAVGGVGGSTREGQVEMAVAVDGTLTPVDELDPHGARDRHQPCNWTPHAQPTLGGGPTTLPLPPRLHLTLNLHPLRRDHVGLMPARVPAARGPPALA